MNPSFFRSSIRALFVAPVAICLGTSLASATNNCVFVTAPKTMTLQGPCSTDDAILIPNGVTLNGQGFKITAVDPAGGNFKGAVLKNAGKTANVTNLFIRTNLADVCNDEADRIVGILLDKGVGTISSVNITMNKGGGTSVCPEGIAVVAQNLPFSAKSSFNKVTIKTSTLNNNQRAAVVVRGNVSARVEANLMKSVVGLGVAQRGVEGSDGAKMYVLNNEILRHSHSPIDNDPSYGIFLNGVGQTTVLTNTLNFNDYGLRISGSVKVTAKGNIIRSSVVDGILLDDGNGLACKQNLLWANDSGKNGGNGIHLINYYGLATDNLIKNSLTERNTGSGIAVEGAIPLGSKRNKVQVSTSSLNDVFDIQDLGTTTIYSKNVCTTSTGAPVDCPAVP